MSKRSEPLTDLGLETLSEVFDSAAWAKHLRGVSLGQCNEGTVEEVRIVRVLKHHVGQRSTLEIGLRTENGWDFLIGKIYRDDRPDIFQAMERIQHKYRNASLYGYVKARIKKKCGAILLSEFRPRFCYCFIRRRYSSPDLR